jgi:hypothetical protein
VETDSDPCGPPQPSSPADRPAAGEAGLQRYHDRNSRTRPMLAPCRRTFVPQSWQSRCEETDLQPFAIKQRAFIRRDLARRSALNRRRGSPARSSRSRPPARRRRNRAGNSRRRTVLPAWWPPPARPVAAGGGRVTWPRNRGESARRDSGPLGLHPVCPTFRLDYVPEGEARGGRDGSGRRPSGERITLGVTPPRPRARHTQIMG